MYWDSSAIVPLVLEEPRSGACRAILRRDRRMVTWALTALEVLSALSRRVREAALEAADLRRARLRLERYSEQWTEVDALGPVREHAERLLLVHSLRAGDALQLAAALVAADLRPRRLPFVALDDGLLAAAEKEGFESVRPGE